jgi:hypothetical protein
VRLALLVFLVMVWVAGVSDVKKERAKISRLCRALLVPLGPPDHIPDLATLEWLTPQRQAALRAYEMECVP